MRPILILLLLTAAAVAAPQIILVREDGSFRGPFTHDEPAAKGETVVLLTPAQFAAIDELRRAHPAAGVVWTGAEPALHPIETMRTALLAEFRSLSIGEQTLYSPTVEALARLFARADLTVPQKTVAAREVITLAPVATEALAAARLRLLALLP